MNNNSLKEPLPFGTSLLNLPTQRQLEIIAEINMTNNIGFTPKTKQEAWGFISEYRQMLENDCDRCDFEGLDFIKDGSVKN